MSALVACAIAAVGVVSLGLTFLLYQPDGQTRLADDWRRLQVSRTLSSANVTSAFNELYADSIGKNASPEQIHAWFANQLQSDGVLVLDTVMANYIHAKVGQIDGRTLPAGVYVGAGPIGPNIWPVPILSHYLFFPHHGYVLVVPFAENGSWPPAIEVSASVDRHFEAAGPPVGDLFAVRQVYNPDAFDFPHPGEPIHDLFLVINDPEEVRQTTGRLDEAIRRLSAAELPYLLVKRNSNSALGCFLRVSGVRREALDRLGSNLMTQLRLPGIGQDLWSHDQQGAIPECTSS